VILENLEAHINPTHGFLGNKSVSWILQSCPLFGNTKLLTLIGFFAQKFTKVIALLNYFEKSDLFGQAMQKFELWDPIKNNGNIFPRYL
jgi:hypothetical protein